MIKDTLINLYVFYKIMCSSYYNKELDLFFLFFVSYLIDMFVFF